VNLARPGKIYAQWSRGRVRAFRDQHGADYKGKIEFMPNEIRRLMRDPNLIPPERQSLLLRIADQSVSMGMPCYLVGGFVRSLLLGKLANDLDIIVEGDAIELGGALVKKHGGKLTSHTKFRTAIWHLPSTFKSHLPTIDLITARKETYKIPGALPTVKPSTIDDDLRRRDFTVSAMAVRLDGDHFGELLDPLGGQNDLKQKLIRILHPRSFLDDPTRIFRAVRFEQRLAFHLESSTFNLINSESLAVLEKLSGERIRHEFDLIFGEENPVQMLARLHEVGVFNVFEPSLPIFNDKYSGLINSRPPEEFGISQNRVLLGYLLWLIDSSVDITEYISKRFDFTSELSNASIAVIQLKNDLPQLKQVKPSEWTLRLEKIPLIAIYVLWLISNEPALKEFLVKWRLVKATITGDDLKARGIPIGPHYKEILSTLRAAWLDGEVENHKEEEELLNTLL
jgi:tRNA nucleotidyltransferase (CCA-adding enzyme)